MKLVHLHGHSTPRIFIHSSGRMYITFYVPSEHKQFVSTYARYLMMNHLQRDISSDEVIHHIDGDITNDDISNLEVVDKREHWIMHGKIRLPIALICAFCGTTFDRSANDIRKRMKALMPGPFCCMRCANEYKVNVRHGNMERLPPFWCEEAL